MFERYTERARRVIFFARYEAAQLGHDQISDADLLLGLIREARALFMRLLPNEQSEPGGWTFEALHRRIADAAGPTGKRVSTSVDMPLSDTGRRVLGYAADEAESLGHRHIGTEHVLLGLLRAKDSVAATILRDLGIDAEKVRSAIMPSPGPPGPPIGATERPARGGLIGSRGIPNAVIEFICDGAVIASVVLFPGWPVPRVGEQITLTDKEGAAVAYRVETLSYVYERHPPDMVVAPHRLAKVMILVRRDPPES